MKITEGQYDLHPRSARLAPGWFPRRYWEIDFAAELPRRKHLIVHFSHGTWRAIVREERRNNGDR
jgi:hypothetical protein